MDDKTLTAASGVIAAIVGGVAAWLVKGAEAKHKISELKLSYEQKLRDLYLTSARTHTEELYIPLSKAIAGLNSAFNRYKQDAAVPTASGDSAEHKLYEQATSFNSVVSTLLEDGSSAFLTTELDEKLSSFCAFLDGSLVATEPVVRVSIGFILPYLGSPYEGDVEHALKGKWARRLGAKKVSFKLALFDIGFSYEATEVLAAPVQSREFQAQFSREIRIINMLVKEVTLGSSKCL